MSGKIRLEVGTRVFNAGDMANQEHFGTVAEIRGDQVRVEPDDGKRIGWYEDGTPVSMAGGYWVPRCLFGEYAGTHYPRMTTEESYRAYHAERIRRLQESMRRMAVK